MIILGIWVLFVITDKLEVKHPASAVFACLGLIELLAELTLGRSFL